MGNIVRGSFRGGFAIICFSFLVEVSADLAWSIQLPTCESPGAKSLVTHSCNGNDKFRLHCILRDDYQPVLLNITWRWISKGHCPYFREQSGEIDEFKCEGKVCPDDITTDRYQSFQVYKYPGCTIVQKEEHVSEPVTKANPMYNHSTSRTNDKTCINSATCFHFSWALIYGILVSARL